MNEIRIKVVARNPVVKSIGSPQPFISLEDIESNTGRLLTATLPLKAAEDSVAHQPGDVLFGKLRPYLAKSLLCESEGTATGELLVLRPDQELDARFLFYVTLSQTWLSWANATSYGSKMPRTSWETLAEYRLWLPPLEEQRRITDFLDAEISRHHRLEAAMRQHLDQLSQRRRSAVNLTWPRTEARHTRLGYRVALVTSGPRGWSDYVANKGTLFFRSANLRRDSIAPNLESVVYVDTPKNAAAELIRSRTRSGDVLVGITGANTGWVTLATEEITGANVSQHVCLIRPIASQVNSRWLAYLISSSRVQDKILASQYGGTKTQLSLPDIRNISLPSVDIRDQQRVAQEIDHQLNLIDRQSIARASQLVLLRERRQALITAAVSGQFDVTTARSGVA